MRDADKDQKLSQVYNDSYPCRCSTGCQKGVVMRVGGVKTLSFVLLLGLSQVIFVANFFWSLFRGKVAGRNPWHSNTLEWTAPSPPPHGNFEETPIVRRGPYEYGHPEMEQDYLPQTEAHGPTVAAAH